MNEEQALAVLDRIGTAPISETERGQVAEARAHLAARIAGLEAELARVRRAAKMGMDAAHNIAAHDLALGRRMQAESKPEAVASEREANSMLTEMLDAAEARATRAEAELAAVLNFLRDDSLAATFQTLGQYRAAAIDAARGGE